MKLLSIVFILSLSTLSFADTTSIANCPSVEHHGIDLELRMEDDKIVAEIYTDGDEDGVRNLTSDLTITKSRLALEKAPAQSWAIRQAIKGSKEVDQSGVVVIKGTINGRSIMVNLNTYAGGNFMVVDDYVLALDCK